MCDPLTAAIGTALGASAGTAAAVGTAALGIGAGTALQVYQGEKARKAQNQAADRARSEADQAFNRTNGKKPNASALLAGNLAAANAGGASTMLTGVAGVDRSALTLGRATLLGG